MKRKKYLSKNLKSLNEEAVNYYSECVSEGRGDSSSISHLDGLCVALSIMRTGTPDNSDKEWDRIVRLYKMRQRKGAL